MRTVYIKDATTMRVNASYEGESLEKQLQKATTSKIPIEATSPIIFTEKKNGVMPETDIRTDKWEIAREAMGAVHKTAIAKRQGVKPEASEPTQATD